MKLVQNALLVMCLTGCALIMPAPTLITIRVVSPSVAVNASSLQALQFFEIKADSSLHNTRVLVVVDQHQLMQHEGLRWVSAPAAMLEANLQRMSGSTATSSNAHTPETQLQLHLTAFQINTKDAKQLGEANIAFDAELRCGFNNALQKRRFNAATPVVGRQSKQVALAFQSAQDIAVDELLSWLPIAMSACQPS